MAIDRRKPLHVLRSEWEQCTACPLGERRVATNGPFIFGEGVPGAIMFIGEGPGEAEEETGRPFTGAGGKLLRAILAKSGVNNVYFTDVVCCRSFSYQYDSEGHQRYNTYRGVSTPAVRDDKPKPAQTAQCRARLYEEVYLVDPVLIVTLGPVAAEAVLGHPVKGLQTNSKLRPDVVGEQGTILRLPGAGASPALTPKGAWRRKVRGEYIMPTVPALVEYPVLPLISPLDVLNRESDRTIGSPRDSFSKGLTSVLRYYNDYLRFIGASHHVIADEYTVSIDQIEED